MDIAFVVLVHCMRCLQWVLVHFFLHLQATSAVQELAIAAYAGALTNKREPT